MTLVIGLLIFLLFVYLIDGHEGVRTTLKFLLFALLVIAIVCVFILFLGVNMA